jgi:hypothetical protein
MQRWIKSILSSPIYPAKRSKIESRPSRYSTSGLEPLTLAPATSLLAYVLAHPTVSGNCAYLGGFDDLKASP